MIRIYKDKDNKYVTKGAYEMFYKPLGYKIVLDIEPQKIEETKEEVKVQLEEVVRNKDELGSSTRRTEEGELIFIQDIISITLRVAPIRKYTRKFSFILKNDDVVIQQLEIKKLKVNGQTIITKKLFFKKKKNNKIENPKFNKTREVKLKQ